MHFISEKNQYIILVLFFVLTTIIFIITDYTFLGLQDETQLQAILKSGDVFNGMTSYPFAVIVGSLYSYFPHIQWYSVMMIASTFLIMGVLSLYIVKIDLGRYWFNIFFKIVLFLIALIVLTYAMLNINITALTLFLVVVSVPFIRTKPILFWSITFIASFLREEMIFAILPLLVIVYVINIDRQYLDKKKILISLVLFIGILFNHFSYTLDTEYKKWLDFTEKRAYYTDFGGSTNHNDLLTHDEYQLAKTWWILDLDLYPVDKIYKAAGSTLDIVEKRLYSYTSTVKYIERILQRHPILYWLLGLSFLIAFILKSGWRLGWYLLFAMGVIILLVLKDVERVTLPILLLWSLMLFVDIWYANIAKFKWIREGLMLVLLLVIASILWVKLPLNKIYEYEEKEALLYELKDIIQRNSMQLEITSGFASSWTILIDTLMENHLFDEENWVGYDRELLLSGWFTKSPLPYKQHKISFDGIKRRYNNFHDWMLVSNHGFIGSKGESSHISVFLALNLMRMYDETFPKDGCNHMPIIVDQSQHFIIHRIIQRCSNIHDAKNVLFDKNAKIWDFKSVLNPIDTLMHYENTILHVNSNDPKFLVEANNSTYINTYTLFRLVIDSPIKTTLQIFYKENKAQRYAEHQSYSRVIEEGKNTIALKIPTRYIENGLRVDPVKHKGSYRVEEMAFYQLKI